MSITTDELQDLAERASAYAGIASDARKLGQIKLAEHCERLSSKYSREYDDALETTEHYADEAHEKARLQTHFEYDVPVDPASLNDCEACQ